ncbi:MAG: glycoside hydrolase family 3 C-terminal domain-containing protein [Acidobacteriia bacterium]|nr:glycoside hydrolase family 3 C-terminal domain-containing protein [Terriglobia bacterium]
MALLAVLCVLFAVILAPLLGQGSSQPPTPAHPWMDRSLSPDRRADLVMEQMTLDEKIGLVHGAGLVGFETTPEEAATGVLARSNGGAGFVPGIPRLGLPDLNMADSAVGVARSGAHGRYSTPLPSTLAEAASWDLRLAHDYGALIGRELRDQGYNMALGGGVNLTREPRNGRNFEYQGEDPILAGRMVAQLIQGVQEQGVIGDIKHYAFNDQETGRHVASVNLDRRVMRETDLLAFEIGVKESNVGAVMCSYNRINGDYACENSYTLNEVLKKAWGFKGFVISDWGGTHSTVKAALAGLDQEQPGSVHFGDALKKAVEAGAVPAARLNDMVHRILRTEFAAGIVDNPPVPRVVDVFGGLEMAQRFAEQGTVLLKNANGQLPLDAGRVKSLAVIGSHADVGVISGGGSGQVDPPGGNAVANAQGNTPGTEADAIWGPGAVWHPSSPLKAIRAKVPKAQVEFADGADLSAAAALARRSAAAIVFVHQPSSEGRDLSLSLPGNQDQLVSAVAAANPRTIVVVESGGPVAMPWIGEVNAVLEAWFPGIRGGEALAAILFGDVNPSAKLPVTFAKSEADLPHPRVPGTDAQEFASIDIGATQPTRQPIPFDIHYSEGLKVGYKWFDAEDKQPLFAFGHGLSYTTFAYSGLQATPKEVTFAVKNTGSRAGAEIAQVYVGLPASTHEPPQRLVAWDKVRLAAGESKRVSLKLDPQLLSIFDVEKNAWDLVPGSYKVLVGGSSRAIALSASVQIP